MLDDGLPGRCRVKRIQYICTVDPSGNGSFDADVVVTVDLRQVVGYHKPTNDAYRGRKSQYAYEDLKTENFTLYKVNVYVVNSDGVGGPMAAVTDANAPAWAKFEGISGGAGRHNFHEIVKGQSGKTTDSRR